MNSVINWNVKNKIAHLILNNPPSNQMSESFFSELKYLTESVVLKSDVIGIIIYGQGRHFSSGADVDYLLDNIKSDAKVDNRGNIIQYPNFLKENNKYFLFFENLKIPVIAVLKGVCLGSALELALFCHIRLCEESCLFGFPETSFNLIPGCGGTKKILSYVSYSKALELILGGSNFNAREAVKWNIADKILPKKSMIESAEKLAKMIHKDYKKEKARFYVEKYLK